MNTIKVSVNADEISSFPSGYIDYAQVDATDEQTIHLHQAEDEAEARLAAAKFARSVRKRLGLTQQQFAAQIEVSVDTIRNWEQGKRQPAGPAKALLRVLSNAPEMALSALR